MFIGAKRRPLTAAAAEGTHFANLASAFCFQYVYGAALRTFLLYANANDYLVRLLISGMFTCVNARVFQGALQFPSWG